MSDDQPVVATVARELLTQLDSLTAIAVQEYHRTVLPGYDRVDRDDLAKTAAQNLRTRLEYLSGGRAGLAVRESAASLGRRRSAVGVPLESVLRLSRIEARLLWDWFYSAAVALDDPGALASLLRDAAAVWDASDEASESIVDAYRSCREEQQWRDHDYRLQVFDRLTSGAARPDDVREFSRLFGMAVHRRYVVVALRSDGSPAGSQRTVVRLLLAGDGLQSQWRDYGEHEIAVIPMTDQDSGVIADRLVDTGYLVGVSPVVDGLTSVHRAAALATLALRVATPGNAVRRLDTSVLEVAAQADFDLTAHLSEGLSEDFARAGIRQPDRLVEAVIAFAEEGSVEKAAVRLYVHGNTVRNYFGLISDACGLSLRHGGEAASLILRCYAWRATHSHYQRSTE